ncbi:prephenate dehydratase [Alkalihalobacterium bogoriense]|uniref:prephenate dehydratase n=1 Tax=Alkalihalobacterium bogoriense TaxID=246272 RepID=UPI000479997D|nr:prephenate dehydratase [Alkalihalobacterium bogoriense]
MRTIGYLGPKGTFTEMAVNALFPKEKTVPYTTIPNCMDAVSNESVDIAVVPLENAIEGSVNVTLDYIIHKHTLPIVGEIIVPIEQQLLVNNQNKEEWSTVEVIYSHPHAIAQCHDFLRNVLPNARIQYMNSTGAAAQYVNEHPEEKAAAIANELAATVYDLSIVERNIHDYGNNRTRFVLLAKEAEKFSSPLYVGDKTTMMFTLPSDFSGALHQVLSAFAWRKLNLSKIESRPMKTGLGNYYFVIDVEHALDDVLIPGVTAELEALGCGVRILGSYPCYSLNKEKDPVPK